MSKASTKAAQDEVDREFGLPADPSTTQPIKLFDVVQLRSGGTVMTVTDMLDFEADDDEPITLIEVTFIDYQGMPQTSQLPYGALKHAERA